MKKIRLSTSIALIVLAISTTIPATIVAYNEHLNSKQGDYQRIQKELSKIYEVVKVIDENYIGVVDKDTAYDRAALGYVSGIGDKWSYYLSAEEYKEHKENAKRELVGIGVNVVYDSEKQAILITHVYPDSPAEQAGLQKLDYITAVNGTKVSVAGYQETVDLVRGDVGTTVKITTLRDGQEQTYIIKRAKVNKITVNGRMIEDNIGYISISEFALDTSIQFENEIKKLKQAGAQGFIFDVRNNPGGYLSELIDMLDFLLPEGIIITTQGIDGQKQDYPSDNKMLDMPFVVLVNENSVSAAEFFAAAIQEYNVGKVIGEKTGGKGYTQAIIELSDGSAINLSMNKYYTPQGKSLADTGVIPDTTVVLSKQDKKDFYFLTDKTDKQMQKAISEVLAKMIQ